MGIEVARRMALMKLLAQLTVGAVNDTAAFHRRTVRHIFRPALHVGVFFCIQELGGIIDVAERHAAKPRPDGHIGDGVLFTCHVTPARQLLIQNIKQTFGFHREAVDRVLNLHRRIIVEVAETATEKRCRALQPEKPVERFSTARRIFWQEVTKFLCEV